MAEARSGKALLQVQVTHSEVYLSGAVARLQLCGSLRELRVIASNRLPATFYIFPEAGWGGRGTDGREGTGEKAAPASTRDCGSNGRTMEN